MIARSRRRVAAQRGPTPEYSASAGFHQQFLAVGAPFREIPEPEEVEDFLPPEPEPRRRAVELPENWPQPAALTDHSCYQRTAKKEVWVQLVLWPPEVERQREAEPLALPELALAQAQELEPAVLI